MKKYKQIFIALFCLSTYNVFGQSEFSNTLFYNDSIASPKADLSSLKWIEGHWRGEAFGGITEEVWTPALGGSMMCAFKLVVNNQVKLYELVTIVEENGSLILKLKHFHSDLKGWEERDDTVDFRLVRVTDDKVYFDGFTFERISDNEINMYVVLKSGDDKAETKFNYLRVKK